MDGSETNSVGDSLAVSPGMKTEAFGGTTQQTHCEPSSSQEHIIGNIEKHMCASSCLYVLLHEQHFKKNDTCYAEKFRKKCRNVKKEGLTWPAWLSG